MDYKNISGVETVATVKIFKVYGCRLIEEKFAMKSPYNADVMTIYAPGIAQQVREIAKAEDRSIAYVAKRLLRQTLEQQQAAQTTGDT